MVKVGWLLVVAALILSGCGTDLTKYDLAYLACSEGLGFDQAGLDNLWQTFQEAKNQGVTFEDAAVISIRVCENACAGDADCGASCRACVGLIAEGVYKPDGSGPSSTATPPPLPSNPTGYKFPLAGKYADQTISGFGFGEPLDTDGDGEVETCSDDITPLLHTGVDYRASGGNNVYAIADGSVRFAETRADWGGYVVVEHTGKDDKKGTSTYTHVVPTVSAGQTVVWGQKIATIYPATIAKDGWSAHLHFQVRTKPYHSTWSLRGRLPEAACNVNVNGTLVWEPEFPDGYIDPATVNWEK